MKPVRILHVAANFPDGVFKQPTTNAVKNLIDMTRGALNHCVVSICRTGPFNHSTSVRRGDDALSISYRGLPVLLGARFSMARLAKRIRAEVGGNFDLVHAHKLTVEGWVGRILADEMRVPLVITIRGYTDLRMLKLRRDLRSNFSEIYDRAALKFFPAPWTVAALKKALGRANEKEMSTNEVILPNIVGIPLGHTEGNLGNVEHARFYTVFRAGQGKAKGFITLLEAASQLRNELPDQFLDVFGCEQNSWEAEQVERKGLGRHIRFLGKLPNNELLNRISSYDGFLLPSSSETFGMSYIEALLSGVPILYSANTGVDGYFPEVDVGERVDARSVADVQRGLRRFLANDSSLRESVRSAREQGRFRQFIPSEIASLYSQQMRRAVLSK